MHHQNVIIIILFLFYFGYSQSPDTVSTTDTSPFQSADSISLTDTSKVQAPDSAQQAQSPDSLESAEIPAVQASDSVQSDGTTPISQARQIVNVDAFQKSEMKKLHFLEGQWKGEAWMLTPNREKQYIIQTENVEVKQDGLVIEESEDLSG